MPALTVSSREIASSFRERRTSPMALRYRKCRQAPAIRPLGAALRPEHSVIADTFIRRPILASVCSLVIILAGAIAIPTLPIAQFPELAPPQVQVTALYNGADARTVETAVTTPLEQAINGVEGMQYMTSTSGNDGTSARRYASRTCRSAPARLVESRRRQDTRFK